MAGCMCSHKLMQCTSGIVQTLVQACSDTQVSVSSLVLNIPYLWASPKLQFTNQLFLLTGGGGLPECHGQPLREGDEAGKTGGWSKSQLTWGEMQRAQW